MANKHPYIGSGGPLVQAVEQFKKSFPQTVDASTFKKLGIAPKNESYLINIFKFLSLIDSENNQKTPLAEKIFFKTQKEDFEEAFSKAVRDAYSEIFDLHGDNAWQLSNDQLISFFREHDKSSQIVGTRQASTFAALAALAGKREIAQSKPTTAKPKQATKPPAKKSASKAKISEQGAVIPGSTNTPDKQSDVALTVRIEVNLPSDASQETYDHIFKSIRKNLIDGKSS